MSALPPSPIEYYARDDTTAGARRFSFAGFFAGCAFVALISRLMVMVVPHFETAFKDFGARLPAVTQLVLDISRWFRGRGWIPVCLIPFVVGLIVPFLLPAEPGQRRIGAEWVFIVLLCLAIAIGLFVAVALYMPMITLMQSVSGGKR